MRTMYDSVDANAIPADARMVAGYVDGRYAWSKQDWDRFPHAVKVRISAIGETHLAHVFDVEVGCIWPPANVVPLVVAARRAGIDPTVYVNEVNDWRPTKDAFDRAGVAHPHWWLANYDGRADYITPGAVARQYAHPHDGDGVADRPWETGGHYDLSAVRDFWPGVDGNEGDDDMAGEGPRILAILENLNNWLLKGGTGDTDRAYAGEPVNGLGATSIAAVTYDTNRALRSVYDKTGMPVGDALVELLKRSLADVDEAELAEELAKRGIGGTDPAAVKAALAEVLRKGTEGVQG